MVQRMSLRKMKQFFADYNIKHTLGIPHNSAVQAVRERSNQTTKDMLNKPKGMENTPRNDYTMFN